MWFTIANIGTFVFSVLYMMLSIIKVQGVKWLMSGENLDEELLESKSNVRSMNFCTRLFMITLFFVDTFTVYVLMLLIMTFNGWVVLSLVAGLTVGYSFK
jgi:hypothetical protein